MQVILTLADNIYRQVEDMAQARNQPVADVLAETIRQAFPPLRVNKNRAKMQQEVAAFEASHADLWRGFANQFAALQRCNDTAD